MVNPGSSSNLGLAYKAATGIRMPVSLLWGDVPCSIKGCTQTDGPEDTNRPARAFSAMQDVSV